MPRYIVEHDLVPGPGSSAGEEGAKACRVVSGRQDSNQVTWLHVYMSLDKKKSFSIYDAPSREAIQQVVSMNDLSVKEITEVTALDLRSCH